MSNTHEPPQHNTEEATNNSNATTLLDNIYVNIDAGLTIDAANEIIEKAKNKMAMFDSIKIKLPPEEVLCKRQWSKMDVKKFNLNFNGKTASEIIDFGFVTTEVDGKKFGHVAITKFAGDILIDENFTFVSTKVFQSFSAKIMAYISSLLTGISFNNCKFTDMNIRMSNKLICILQAGLDSTCRVDDASFNDSDFFLLTNIFCSDIMKSQVSTMYAHNDGRQKLDGSGSKVELVLRNVYLHYKNKDTDNAFNTISYDGPLDKEKILKNDYFKSLKLSHAIRGMSFDEVTKWLENQRRKYTKDYGRVHRISGQHDTSNPWNFFGGDNRGKPVDYKNFYFYLKMSEDRALHDVFYGAIPVQHLNLSATQSERKKRRKEDDKSLKIIIKSQKQTRECMEKIASRFNRNSVLTEVQVLDQKLDRLGARLFTFEEKICERTIELEARGISSVAIQQDALIMMYEKHKNKVNDEIVASELEKVEKKEELDQLKNDKVPEAITHITATPSVENSVEYNSTLNRSSIENDSIETDTVPENLSFTNITY